MKAKSVLIVVLLIGCVALAGTSAAQQPATGTGTLTGTLTNGLTGAVVAKALVILESTSFTREVTSGADGKYSVTNVPPGPYHLIVRADGYLPSRTETTVRADSRRARGSSRAPSR